MKKTLMILSSLLFAFSMPISAEETETSKIKPENPEDVLAEGYAEYNKKMIANHETYNNALSIDVKSSDLYEGFDNLKTDFDLNVGQYGTISAFAEDDETKEILDSLNNQTETQEIQEKINKYKTNASGWITAKKNSKKAETKTKYKTQKAADTAYNDYSKKYDEAISSMKKDVDKEDIVSFASQYPKKIDEYQKNVQLRAEGERVDSTIQLTAPKLSNVALNVATDTTIETSLPSDKGDK